MEPQGKCETTLTERFKNPDCRCDTYTGNLGPCLGFEAGANGRCVYCDHSDACHPKPDAPMLYTVEKGANALPNRLGVILLLIGLALCALALTLA